MSRCTLLLLLLASGLIGCSDEPDTPAAVGPPPAESASDAVVVADSDAVERGNSAAADFSDRLRAALQQRMQSQGPAAAVDFCHAQAPRIAEAVMAEHAVRLGRVAVPGRNRNAQNAPVNWQLAALAGFQSQVDAGATPGEQLFVQRDDLPPGVALRMMRGIAVEPACLACHGQAVSAPVAQAIARHYPGDAATGFDIGDLRGGLWVEVPQAHQPDREKLQ